MTSAIDSTKPTSGSAQTADVRSNFATAASEITALQNGSGLTGLADTSTTTLGDYLVGVKRTATGATATNLHNWIEGQVLNVKTDFGAVGDGVTDDTSAIQTAINAAISSGKKLILPVGVYSISSPLFIYKWSGTAFSFVSATIEGEKQTWDSELAGSVNSTRIVPTFKTTFAIGIQNGRGVRIKDVTLIGLNAISLSSDNHEMMTNSTFVTASCRDSRYSPYAGICIDPFGTSVPADGGYPGLSAYYVASAAGSSRIELDSVYCKNFVVGTMITPNGTTLNAEDIEFKNCAMTYGKVGVATGQSQSRDVNWRGGNNAFNLYCFDGNTYGAQQGQAPKIYGCNMAGKYLFNVWNRGGDALYASGVYAESFSSIGFLGGATATAASPHIFTGSSFSFWDGGTGIFPDNHLIAQGSVTFEGCLLSTSALVYPTPIRMFHRTGAPINFHGCELAPSLQSEFWLAPSEGTAAAGMDECYFNSSVFSDGSSRGNSTSQCSLSHFNLRVSAAGLDRIIVPLGATIKLNGGTATDIFFIGDAEKRPSLGSLTVTTGANGTATFTASDVTIVRLGDLIYTNTSVSAENYAGSTFSSNWTCLGIVTAINGSDVTISGWPQSLSTGTYSLFDLWWNRFHQASTGDTHTNTTIDNVTNPTTWAIGNKIMGAGITDGTYITNIVGSTFTVSKATSATTAGVRLFDANVYKLTGTAV